MTTPETVRDYRVGDLRVDLVARTVRRGGDLLPVKGLSFELLVCLIRHHPGLATARAIHGEVWGDNVVGTSTLAQRVELLREALAGSGEHDRYIEAVESRGYQLVVPVAAEAPREHPGPDPDPPARRHGARSRAFIGWSALLGLVVFIVGLWSARPTATDDAAVDPTTLPVRAEPADAAPPTD